MVCNEVYLAVFWDCSLRPPAVHLTKGSWKEGAVVSTCTRTSSCVPSSVTCDDDVTPTETREARCGGGGRAPGRGAEVCGTQMLRAPMKPRDHAGCLMRRSSDCGVLRGSRRLAIALFKSKNNLPLFFFSDREITTPLVPIVSRGCARAGRNHNPTYFSASSKRRPHLIDFTTSRMRHT